MICFYRKKGILKIADVWFAEGRIKPEKRVDIVSYTQTDVPFGKYITKPTLVNDLTETEDDLLLKIDKQYRYEIRRAERDGAVCKVRTGGIKEDIAIFVENYIQFLQEKHLPLVEYAMLVEHLSFIDNANGLTITTAEINEQTRVWHVYIHDGNTTRLMYSMSHFRGDELKAQIGMANRLLHWRDMQYFKALGYKKYDWGGAGTSEDVKSITEFKRKFGGADVNVYTVQEGASLLGKIAICFKSLLSR